MTNLKPQVDIEFSSIKFGSQISRHCNVNKSEVLMKNEIYKSGGFILKNLGKQWDAKNENIVWPLTILKSLQFQIKQTYLHKVKLNECWPKSQALMINERTQI